MLARALGCVVALSILTSSSFAKAPAARKTPIKVGDKAPTLVVPGHARGTGKDAKQGVDLAKVYKQGTTVLVMLRGYPGYQCTLCTRQVGSYRKLAKDFEKAGVQVVLVYPGGVSNLKQRADEFLKSQPLPKPLTMVLDPEYKLTDAYGLRWDAPRETAYPSTFVIAKDRVVKFAKVSKSHGGRVPAKDALKQAMKLKEAKQEKATE